MQLATAKNANKHAIICATLMVHTVLKHTDHSDGRHAAMHIMDRRWTGLLLQHMYFRPCQLAARMLAISTVGPLICKNSADKCVGSSHRLVDPGQAQGGLSALKFVGDLSV